MKIYLTPENVDFEISTVGVHVVYSDVEGSTIEVDARIPDAVQIDSYTKVKIHFPLTAELTCVTMNFFELHHKDIVLGECSARGAKKNQAPGIYTIENSEKLKLKSKIYDPHNIFNLRHYLVCGSDSYVEVISQQYTAHKTIP